MTEADLDGLKKLRTPFPPEQVGKLPKGGVFLDFVGHGWLTQRLLDVDPLWTWEPFAVDDRGLPLIDANGGLWIRLTVCGVTRIGYGDGRGNNAIKEAIGDALRNAGMRFGIALDLWCKGDPDAPPAPTPREQSLADLAALCKRKRFDTADVGRRFNDEHGYAITEADQSTIEAFTAVLSKEGATDATS
jgi:hypothetical protein